MTEIERYRLCILAKADKLRADGNSLHEAARQLGVSERGLYNWAKWRAGLSEAQKAEAAAPVNIPVRAAAPGFAAQQITSLPRAMPADVLKVSPAELVSELADRCRSLIVVAELLDGTYLIEISGDHKQYELLCALQSLKAGARFKP